jgi:hypothetical protein
MRRTVARQKKEGNWAYACNPSYSKAEVRKLTVPGQLGQIVYKTPSQKHPTRKRAGGVTQVVEHLPSKYEDLSSKSRTPKKKKKDRGIVTG